LKEIPIHHESGNDSIIGEGGQGVNPMEQILQLLTAQNQRLTKIEHRQAAEREAHQADPAEGRKPEANMNYEPTRVKLKNPPWPITPNRQKWKLTVLTLKSQFWL
jgi:hypothetical protein